MTAPNHSTTTPSSYFQEFTSRPPIYGNSTSPGLLPFYTLATPAFWRPAVTECSHIFSTYVVPNVLHFLAFFIGFYLFRIQESEGLNALIEKVNIYSYFLIYLFSYFLFDSLMRYGFLMYYLLIFFFVSSGFSAQFCFQKDCFKAKVCIYRRLEESWYTVYPLNSCT